MPKLDKKEVFKLLEDSETHAFTLLSICLNEWPDDYFEVDFLEILARISDRFGVGLSQAGESKLQALTVAMTTDAFESDPSVFDSVCKALATGDPDLDDPDDKLSPVEALWAQYEIKLAINNDPVLTPQVEAYVDSIVSSGVGTSEEEIADIQEDLDETRNQLSRELSTAGFEFDALPEF